MNIVFTCGGTGGHIYPAIAVARMFRERQPDCRILFIGAEDGMENKLVPREGFELQTVQISNYQRKLTPAAIWHNLVTVRQNEAHPEGLPARRHRRYRRLRQLPRAQDGREARHPHLRA